MVRLIKETETFISRAREFSAGKYTLLDSGEISAANDPTTITKAFSP
jgi:hypothetical protein